jgi:hypothetical protein
MWAKKFSWREWRNKVRQYSPCPGFCDDPDQRRFRFRRWCDLGFKIHRRRGGSTRLYRLYWRTHPVEYQRMLQNLQPKR